MSGLTVFGSAGGGPVVEPQRRVGLTGIESPSAVIDAPGSGDRHSAFPGYVDTAAGERIVVFRRGPGHDFGSGTAGKLILKRTFTPHIAGSWLGNAGEAAGTVIWDQSADAYDPRDSVLWRAPGTRRIYLGFPVQNNGAPGNSMRQCYSDDDGVTWSTTSTVLADATSAGGIVPPKRTEDGNWRWATDALVSGKYRSQVYKSTTGPGGPWVLESTVGSGAAADNFNEWDFVEVTPTNWIGLCRGSTPNTGVYATQSTDGGATWATPVSLAGATGYDAWPAGFLMEDGRPCFFVRGTGSNRGPRILICHNPNAPLTASNWREPGPWGGTYAPSTTGGSTAGLFRNLDSNPNDAGEAYGKMNPVLIGGVIEFAYNRQLSTTVSQVKFAAIAERALGQQRYALSTPATFATDTSWVGSAAGLAAVKFMAAKGGRVRVAYSAEVALGDTEMALDFNLNNLRMALPDTVITIGALGTGKKLPIQRVFYIDLLGGTATTFTANANGTTSLTNIPVGSFYGLVTGMALSGTGVSAGTFIVSMVPGSGTMVVSANVTTGTGITITAVPGQNDLTVNGRHTAAAATAAIVTDQLLVVEPA